ncbi:ATP-grasp domain-containing protein [Treponema zioleckii]|uniref:ATP-grasp domain-containing protein n=1 Tax=Treponema zioleckii TaxID=331680 RepID=UPI00168AFB31|nr:ATP-grasp domain-containing protein [Treponema zioleckii]
MNILFYSTSSNIYDGTNLCIKTTPLCAEQVEELAKKYPEHNFIIATQLPGMFLLDLDGNKIKCKANQIRYEIIEDDNEDKIADFLSSLNPEIAIAASFYVAPYDWLTIKDALVAEKLREKGIKTVCHAAQTALNCFDKFKTHVTLEKFGFNTAKAVYVHHALFVNAGNRREVKSNIYRTAILNEIQKLKYPVIIKDTVGLSSYGADVVNNFEEAKNILFSRKTSSDRIVEELILGEQFGAEIHSSLAADKSHFEHKVFSPFIFSVNRYGITSPKQSVKIGPVESPKYKIEQLKSELKKLADSLNFEGISQVDLVYSEKEEKWYIIEINPRLSGMTQTYAAMCGCSIFELLFNLSGENKKNPEREQERSETNGVFINIKYPLLNEETIKKMKALPFVHYVSQTENKAARQIREQGYCEVILGGKNKADLEKKLFELKETFGGEEIFFKNAKDLLLKI